MGSRHCPLLLPLVIVGGTHSPPWNTDVRLLGTGRFALFDSEKNWDDAFNYCKERGMRLAHVLSDDDRDAIWDLIDDAGVPEEVWIGAAHDRRLPQL